MMKIIDRKHYQPKYDSDTSQLIEDEYDQIARDIADYLRENMENTLKTYIKIEIED